MEFAGWLAVCLGFSLALAGSIKRVPAVWYLLSLGLSALYLYCWFTGKLVALPHVLAAGMRSCLPGTAFMVIVMYVGALPDSLWIKRRLQPIRAELSIMGAFLCLGHIVAFGSSYISWVWGWIPPKVAVPLGMALLLVVLLVLLTATSFSALKRWMGGKRWKRVQK
ncbi:MAG: hypothetical protein IKD70_05975, partial [Eggerthellaceae bacterium]|nr:hypothetical protein [Eggerthellaceae bacterium]